MRVESEKYICVEDAPSTFSSTAKEEDEPVFQPNEEEEGNDSPYEDIVNSSVEKLLSDVGLSPSQGYISIFDKTYTEGNFTCTKLEATIFNPTTIIKQENPDILQVVGDLFSGNRPEKIIEEYDKNGNMTKKTYYKRNGDYEVSSYKDGKITQKVEVKNVQNDDSGYTTTVERTTYYDNGTYGVQKFTYKMNDECEQPEQTTSYTSYAADGGVDIPMSLFMNFLGIFIGIM